MTLRKTKIDKSVKKAATMTTRIANKLHIFQESEILNQTRERKMLQSINFHKKNEKFFKKVLQQEEDINSLNEN